jgi:hypothetical protein
VRSAITQGALVQVCAALPSFCLHFIEGLCGRSHDINATSLPEYLHFVPAGARAASAAPLLPIPAHPRLFVHADVALCDLATIRMRFQVLEVALYATDTCGCAAANGTRPGTTGAST